MQGAIVLVQVSGSADLLGLHKDLHAVENVKDVFIVAGPTDVVCHVEAPDIDALARTILKMRAVKGVASTDTRLIMPLR